jgi:hypothetical protein
VSVSVLLYNDKTVIQPVPNMQNEPQTSPSNVASEVTLVACNYTGMEEQLSIDKRDLRAFPFVG